KWIYLMLLTDSKERIYHRRALCGLMASCKEPIFPSEGHGSDSVLHEIVVYLQVSIVQICRKCVPSGIGICHSFTDLALWQGVLYFLEDPFAHFVDDLQ